MNKETYEALKRVMSGVEKNEDIPMEDFKRVDNWINQVAEGYEYEEEIQSKEQKENLV